MSSTSTAVRVAQTLGIATSLVLSGSILTFSYAAAPALLHRAPGTEAAPAARIQRQWAALYARGAATAPPLAAFALANLAYVAGVRASAGRAWAAWAAAAALPVLIVPFTLLSMAGANGALHAAAQAKDGEGEEARVRGLLERWTVLNYVRGTFPLVGGVVGLWAALG